MYIFIGLYTNEKLGLETEGKLPHMKLITEFNISLDYTNISSHPFTLFSLMHFFLSHLPELNEIREGGCYEVFFLFFEDTLFQGNKMPLWNSNLDSLLIPLCLL